MLWLNCDPQKAYLLLMKSSTPTLFNGHDCWIKRTRSSFEGAEISGCSTALMQEKGISKGGSYIW